MTTSKAITVTISDSIFGDSLEVLMLPCGKYVIAVPQICKIFSFAKSHESRDIKALLGKSFSFAKAQSDLNSKTVNVMDLENLSKLALKLAFKGDRAAQDLLMASFVEVIERRADQAAGVIREERERDERFKARLDTKTTFRPLTDALKDAGFTEAWQYGRFIRVFQTELGFESGERDKIPFETLIKLGNAQSELKILIRSGYEPWEALDVWRENR